MPREPFDADYRDTYTLIEFTDYCNLRCPMCSHVLMDGPHSAPQGFLDPDLHFAILKRLRPRRTHHALKLFWLGESFLHPDFYDLLKGTYTHLTRGGYGKEYIDLHTNGHFLTERNIDLLLTVGDKLPRLTLSLDAITPATHARIRRRGDLARVNESIRRFLRERVARGLVTPTLILQFIVMPENAHEAKPFVDEWTAFLDDLYGGASGVGATLGRLAARVRRPEARWFKDVLWLKRVDCSPRLRRMAEEVYRETIVRGGLFPRKTANWEIVASIDNLWEGQRLTATAAAEPLFAPAPEPPVCVEEGAPPPPDLPAPGNDAASGATLGAPREMIETANAFNKEDAAAPDPALARRRPCAGPFKTPCIRWDGELAVCCFDPAMQMPLGNLRRQPFDELWYGDAANAIRLAHIEGRFGDVVTRDGFRKCLKCPGYDTPVLSDDECLAFLRAIGRAELMPVYLERVRG